MDSVPFTLFFVVCLTSLHGILARPNDEWPVECARKNYCFQKPSDYPAPEEIQDLIKKSDIDLSKIKLPSSEDRAGGTESIEDCKHLKMTDHVYMMKDSNDDVRYVIQLPGTFDFVATVEECLKTDLEDFADRYTCKQRTLKINLPVLSLDKSRIELVGVKEGLPSSCSLQQLGSSESD